MRAERVGESELMVMAEISRRGCGGCKMRNFVRKVNLYEARG